jgi:hypothetical protein
LNTSPDFEDILIFFNLDLFPKKQVSHRLFLLGLLSEGSAAQPMDPFGHLGGLHHRGYRARKEELIVAMRAENPGSHSIEIVLKSSGFFEIWGQAKTFPTVIPHESQTKTSSQPLFPPSPFRPLSDLLNNAP